MADMSHSLHRRLLCFVDWLFQKQVLAVVQQLLCRPSALSGHSLFVCFLYFQHVLAGFCKDQALMIWKLIR